MAYMVVPLSIGREDYLSWYQGVAKLVHTKALDGRSVKFPANILQPFITHEGVHGTFAIYFDENNKFKEIKRLN